MNRLAIIATVACLLALASYGGYHRGHRDAERTHLDARVDTLVLTVQKLDTVWRDSVKIATKWRTKYDTVRVRDTLVVVRNDSVIVYIPRVVADSTINACFAVVRSCERAGMAKDTLITALQKQVLAHKPKLSDRLRDGSIGAVVGAMAALLWAAK